MPESLATPFTAVAAGERKTNKKACFLSSKDRSKIH